MPPTEPPEPPAEPQAAQAGPRHGRARHVPAAAALASAVFMGLQVAAAEAWPAYLWGLHHLAFYAPAVRVLAVGAALLLLVLAWRHGALTLRYRWRAPLPGDVVTAVVLAASVLLFWALRIRHLLLGDTGLLVQMGPPAPGFGLGATNNLSLVSLVHAALRHAAVRLEWSDTLAAVACASGAAYVLGMLHLVRRLSTSSLDRLLLFVLVMCVGPVQLFFGYPEQYALPAALTGLTMLCLVRWAGRHASWLVAGVAVAATAVLLHPVAIFLAAPLAAAGTLHATRRLEVAPRGRRTALLVATLPVVLAAVAAWWAVTSHGSVLLLGGAPSPYGLLAAPHLWDVLNVFLLAAPVQGLLVGLVLILGPRAWRRDAVLICLLVATAAAWGALSLIEPSLGALDWDLLSLYAFPLAILSAYAAATYLGPVQVRRALLVVAVGALLHVAPWIGANASPARGAAMVEAMVAHDAHCEGQRRIKLGARLQRMGMAEAAARQYYRVLQSHRDPLALYNLALLRYFAGGPAAEAVDLFREYLRVAPADADPRLALSIVRYHDGDAETAAVQTARFLLDHPHDRGATLWAGALLERLASGAGSDMLKVALLLPAGRGEEASASCRALAQRYPDDRAVQAFAMAVASGSRPDAR